MRLCPKGDVQSARPHETDQEDFDGNALLCNDCKEEELEAEVQAIEASNVVFGLNLIRRSDVYIDPYNPTEVMR